MPDPERHSANSSPGEDVPDVKVQIRARWIPRFAAFFLDYLLVFALLFLIMLRIVFPLFHPEFLEEMEAFLQEQSAQEDRPGFSEQLRQHAEFQSQHERAIADSQFFYVVLLWIYFAGSEILMRGSTLGKKVFRLRTIDLTTLDSPTGKAILIRNFFKTISISIFVPLLLLINVIYPLLNSRRLTGHDRFSKTTVVHENLFTQPVRPLR